MRRISELRKAGARVIRTFRSQAELASAIQAGLDSGRTVVFMPSPRHLREFFNERGFQAVMADVLSRLHSFEVLIEPRFYGNSLAWAVQPGLRDGGVRRASADAG
jgi:hypothetical protein